MYTSYSYDAYKAHDLNLYMKTSSGDEISLDFSKYSELSASNEQNDNSTKTSLTLSEMQSFSYSMKSNGITEQDQKEIDEFMAKAQPYINKFLKEFEEETPKSPVALLARKVASMFNPNIDRDANETEYIKANIVDVVDNGLLEYSSSKNIDKLFEESKKLLEMIMLEFDNYDSKQYA